MDERSRADLDALLKQLDREERSLSAARRQLHDRVDLFAGADEGGGEEAARLDAYERSLSGRRREVHEQIDAMRSAREGDESTLD